MKVRMTRQTPNYDLGQIGELGRANTPGSSIRWVEFGVERHGATGCWCGPGEYDVVPPERRSPFAPGVRCRGCGYQFDAAAGTDTVEAPNPGDLSVCGRCGHLGVYVDAAIGLTLRELTTAERERALQDPHVLKVITALMAINEGIRGSDRG